MAQGECRDVLKEMLARELRRKEIFARNKIERQGCSPSGGLSIHLSVRVFFVFVVTTRNEVRTRVSKNERNRCLEMGLFGGCNELERE